MRIAYWDCFSGIAGDMNLAAMVGCGLAVDDLRADLSGLALEGFTIEHSKVRRGALEADKIDVVIDEASDYAHRGLAEIRRILEASNLPEPAAENAERVFVALCEAEAAVHGVAVDEVHLHEVGAIDAIVDIVGACCGLQRLSIETIRCSPLNVGGGRVATAHGELPVPAPATARLLENAPVYSHGPEVELVTPTGAALVATLAEAFGPWPPMTVAAVGYGAGDKELDGVPNVLRLVVGESLEGAGSEDPTRVSVIETNLDDINPQVIGALIPRLLDAGALDAFTTPVYMKKNRPGFQLTVLAPRERVDILAEIVFRETTTLGVRIYPVDRRELERHHTSVETPWGPVRIKVAMLGEEEVNASPEFDDCERLAVEAGVPVKQVLHEALAAFGTTGSNGAKETSPDKTGQTSTPPASHPEEEE